MTIDEFRATLSAALPPPGLNNLLVALWYDAKGDWNRAHEIVQINNSRAGALLHAYLHRKEGDLANARYWYGQAGRAACNEDLATEWRALCEEFLGGS